MVSHFDVIFAWIAEGIVSFLDVMAIVKEVHELGSINSKATQKPVSSAKPSSSMRLGY